MATKSKPLPPVYEKYFPEWGITVINIKKSDIKEFEYMGRGNAWLCLPHSIFHNPFIMKNEGDRERVLEAYKNHIINSPHLIKKLPTLIDKTLGCYCCPKKCHVEVLVYLLGVFYPELQKFDN